MLTKYPLSLMSSFKLLVPIFALMGSVIFYDEQLEINKIIAFSLIMAGVLIPLLAPLLMRLIERLTVPLVALKRFIKS